MRHEIGGMGLAMLVSATGRSGGLLLALYEIMFSKEDSWEAQYMAALKLNIRSNSCAVFLTSLY